LIDNVILDFVNSTRVCEYLPCRRFPADEPGRPHDGELVNPASFVAGL